MAFRFEKLDIPDVTHVQPDVFRDERGLFSEVYKRSVFAENGITDEFRQINRSVSKQGVLRGLHYQLNPKAQAKLVSVVSGEIFDVAVDIRQGSPWHGKWVGVKLASEQGNMLHVPRGFAHGFCVLSETAEIIYYCDEEYSPEHEGGIMWNDPDVGIEWPEGEPVLSEKDMAYLPLKETEHNFAYS